jgi:uncharacterized radical SAM superfamily protein
MSEIDELIANARRLSWREFGRKITFYHPAMFRYGGEWGKYAAISVTGQHCELQCDHCKAKLLESMIFAVTPEELIAQCTRLDKMGHLGCLITGGFRGDGTLPWGDFVPAVREIKETTALLISVHTGMVDYQTARRLKAAGVDQALIDVIGDEETLRQIYHGGLDIERMEESLDALSSAAIPTIPHIVVGLHYGKIRGEYTAIRIIKRYCPEAVVVVSFMPLPGTPMENSLPPSPVEIARVMATARIEMPNVPISLGCARERGNSEIDVFAVDCGMSRIAIPSQEAIKRAQEYRLDITWKKTCCSIPNTEV